VRTGSEPSDSLKGEFVNHEEFDVVWSGGELLPGRPSKVNSGFDLMPSYDLDDHERMTRGRLRRAYNKSGKYAGERKRGKYVTKACRSGVQPSIITPLLNGGA